MATDVGHPLPLACQAMGTRFELLLRGPGDDVRTLRSAGEAVIEEIHRWHNFLNAFNRASIVSRLNREAAERPVPVPPEVAALLRWCIEVSHTTAGAFNPAIGHLMRKAGFRDTQRAESLCPEGAEVCSHGWRPSERPQPVEADSRLLRPGRGEGTSITFADAIHLDALNRVSFTNPDIALDFGAIGKGWALDRAAELLRESGVTGALIHGGTSSIIAIGEDPYRIALEQDGPVIELSNCALGLSAPSGRQVTDANGATHGHVLDPRTGKSASALTGVAVTGPGAAVCDAWSTALLVDPALARSPHWPEGYIPFTSEHHTSWCVSHKPQNPTSAFCAEGSCLQGSVH